MRDIRAALAATVIVVDNGSSDATARIAREAGARIVHEPRRGHGSACAAGVAALDEACCGIRSRPNCSGASCGTLGGSLRAATRIMIVLARLVLDGRGMPARERCEEVT